MAGARVRIRLGDHLRISGGVVTRRRRASGQGTCCWRTPIRLARRFRTDIPFRAEAAWMATTRRSDVTATAALRMAGAIRRKTFAAACTAAVRMAGASQRRAACTAAVRMAGASQRRAACTAAVRMAGASQCRADCTAAVRMAGASQCRADCTAAVRMAGASQCRAAYTAAWGRADAVAMAPGVRTGPGRSARNV
jgi:hypothetical protein